jgi:catechol 2,3-dioxygenase-like lactoylglutathione lyase family enzyme
MLHKISQISRLILNVADMARSMTFYCGALGFASVGAGTLRLGGQDIELRQSAGRPYPTPRAANDPWFQHFAIAVSDMAAAYDHLTQYAVEPISTGGPQLLPPSTGSVTAFKFRDPDGHPLELSYIPGSAWLSAGQHAGVFLGIDHTALATINLDASIAFYQALGLTVAGRYLNQGPEQDRLDGLSGVELDIVALAPPSGGPHLELLHYRTPTSARAALEFQATDIVSTVTTLTTAGSTVEQVDLRDPSGHPLRLDGSRLTRPV